MKTDDARMSDARQPAPGSSSYIQNQTAAAAQSAGFNISGNGTLGGTLSATNVGIGTVTPIHRLSISGGPSWTSNFWSGAMDLQNGAAIGWGSNSAGWRFGMGHTNGGLFMFRTASNPGTTTSPGIYDLVINDAGNVGIGGTPLPMTKLTLKVRVLQSHISRVPTIGRP